MVECGDLRNRVAIYQSEPRIRENGETEYVFSEKRKIWVHIVPTSGGNAELPGDVEYASVTHKITMRILKNLTMTTDTYFLHQGQRLKVLYWYPVYNRVGWMEVFCRLEME